VLDQLAVAGTVTCVEHANGGVFSDMAALPDLLIAS
jgi:hypothetical protein